MESRKWHGDRVIRNWTSVSETENAINALYQDMFRAMKFYNMVVESDTIKLQIKEETNRYTHPLMINKEVKEKIVKISLECTMRSSGNREYDPEAIYKNGRATAVKWEDGTVTTVKLAPGETGSDYGAFTAALAIKVIGNNSRIKKIMEKKTVIQKKAAKKDGKD